MKSVKHLKYLRYPAVQLILLFILFPDIGLRAQENVESHYVCWSSDIPGSKDRIAYYADSRAECGQGTVTLAYEEFMRLMGDRPIYQNGHSISVQSDCPANCVYITKCLNEADDYRPYFLMIDLNLLNEEFFSSYKRAWTYDTNSKKIISSSSILVCRNNSYDDQL